MKCIIFEPDYHLTRHSVVSTVISFLSTVLSPKLILIASRIYAMEYSFLKVRGTIMTIVNTSGFFWKREIIQVNMNCGRYMVLQAMY